MRAASGAGNVVAVNRWSSSRASSERRAKGASLVAVAAAADDDDPAPILRIPKELDPDDVGANPAFKKYASSQLEEEDDTVGGRLRLVRETKLQRDQRAAEDAERLTSDTWAGDVWRGSSINSLTVLLAIGMVVPAVIGIFAAFTYGSLWGKPM